MAIVSCAIVSHFASSSDLAKGLNCTAVALTVIRPRVINVRESEEIGLSIFIHSGRAPFQWKMPRERRRRKIGSCFEFSFTIYNTPTTFMASIYTIIRKQQLVSSL